jgi:hypothetical protein
MVILHFDYVDFPFVENQVVSVGIRAVLDLRTKPLGLDVRTGQANSLFGYITDHAQFCAWVTPSTDLLIMFLGPGVITRTCPITSTTVDKMENSKPTITANLRIVRVS